MPCRCDMTSSFNSVITAREVYAVYTKHVLPTYTYILAIVYLHRLYLVLYI